MDTRILRCTVCGLTHEDHSDDSLITCEACGNQYLASDGVFLSQKTQKEIDTLANLRVRLSEMIKVNDAKMILSHAQDILKILPEDFLASYFYAYGAYETRQPKFMYQFFKTQAFDTTVAHMRQVTSHMAEYMDIKEYPLILKFIQAYDKDNLVEAKKALKKRIQLEDQYSVIQRDVFICHRSTEYDIVEDVVRALEADGFTCWYSERNLRPDDNENYWKNIEEAIDHSTLFLMISSQSAMLSKDVQRELQYANKKNKKKLEYKIDDSVHTTLFKHAFDGLKWIDASNEGQLESLKQRVYVNLQDEITTPTKRESSSEIDTLSKKVDIELKTSNFKKAKELLSEMKAIDPEYEAIWLTEIFIEFRKHDLESFYQYINTRSYKELLRINKATSIQNYRRLFKQGKVVQHLNQALATKQTVYKKQKRLKLIISMIALILIISAGFFTYQSTPQAVTFDLGIEGAGLNPGDIKEGYTNSLGEYNLPTPTKEGYTFIGWYDNPEFTGNPIETLSPGIPQSYQFYAKWEIQTYSIVYYTNGGDALSEETYAYQETYTLTTPTREGYTFDGWYTASNLLFSVESSGVMPSNDFSVFAKWAINQYTINFDTDGGTDISSITQDYNSTITLPDDPTKEGYTFDGWSQVIPEVMPANNTTITALWTINEYTITFDINGGSSVSSITQDYDSMITLPNDPTKEGYTFGGWFTDTTLTVSFSATTMPAENITLYAKWTVNQYTITFDTDGGTEIASITQDYNSTITLPEEPSKEGYTFISWHVFSVLGIEFNIVTMPSNDFTLVAKWEINQYTITFDTDGGSEVAAITQDYNSTIILPNDPVKEGYTFGGWFIDEALTMSFSATTIPAENVTLYAKWDDYFKVIFETYGGSEVEAVFVEKNTKIQAPTGVTKEGHTLEGWYTSVNGGTTLDERWSFINNSVTNDLILYAKWTINQYTITFDTDGGNEIDSIVFDFDSVITLPEDPVKEGHTFISWHVFSVLGIEFNNDTMPANDIVLVAKWETNLYMIQTITYEDVSSAYLVLLPNERINILSKGVSNAHIIISTSLGRIFSWGRNDYGQLGDGTNTDRNTPFEITQHFDFYSGEIVDTIAVGYDSSILITSFGRVFVWGSNVNGQLGDGTNLDRNTPFEITDQFNFNDGEKAELVSSGNNFIILVTSQGRVFTWGSNWQGRLGDGSDVDRNTPFEITDQFNFLEGETTLEISAGGHHSGLITSFGRVFTWGYNLQGGLGDGSYVSKYIPTEITNQFNFTENETPIKITLGNFFSMLSTSKGRIFTWGENGISGLLGDGSDVDRNTPFEITNQFNFTENETPEFISAGNLHAILVTSKGRIFTWGYNERGALGDGTNTNRNIPTDISNQFSFTEEVVGSFAGLHFSILLTSKGLIFTWGSNIYGQLGDGSDIDRNTPKNISGFIYSIEETSYLYNQSIEEIFNVSREGYTFDGWYLNQNLSTLFTATTMPSENITLYAQWTINQYTITFDTDGGSEVAFITQDYNSGITLPDEPIREGYTFNGWSQVVPNVMPANNITITALWTINEYTITFDSNGGSSVSSITQDYNSTITLPEDPTKEGYTFDGWFKDAELTISFSATTMPAENITLYAKWTTQVNVTFVINDGTEDVVIVSVEKNTSISIPNITREGYSLEGWYISFNNGNSLDEKWIFSSNVVTFDTILYANWIINEYTITFDSNEGTNIDNITQDYNTNIVLSNVPSKDFHIFGGWYIDETLTTPFTETRMPSEDIILYAKWKIDHQKVVYLEGYYYGVKNSNVIYKFDIDFNIIDSVTSPYQSDWNPKFSFVRVDYSKKELIVVGYTDSWRSYENYFIEKYDTDLNNIFHFDEQAQNSTGSSQPSIRDVLFIDSKWHIFTNNSYTNGSRVYIIDDGDILKEFYTPLNIDEEKIEGDIEQLSSLIPSQILNSTQLYLPSIGPNGSLIVWTSENNNLIDSVSGNVYLPLTSGISVKLFANLSIGNEITIHEFRIDLGISNVVSILEALNESYDSVVTIRGYVTMNIDGNNFLLQDDTGAVDIYLGSGASAEKDAILAAYLGGYAIEIQAKRGAYNGLEQVSNVAFVNIISVPGFNFPTPVDVTAMDVTDLSSYTAQLVEFKGLEVVSIAYDNYGNLDIEVTNGTAIFFIRWDSRTGDPEGLPTELVAGDIINVVAGAYWNNGLKLRISSADAVSLITIEFILDLEIKENFDYISTGTHRSFFLSNSNYITTSSSGSLVEFSEYFNFNQERIISICEYNLAIFALTDEGRLFSWGSNFSQLLIHSEDKVFFEFPTEITHFFNLNSGEKLIEINVGINGALALTSEGRVFYWGSDFDNPLSSGDFQQDFYPTDITSTFNLLENEYVIQVEVGYLHNGILTNNGRVFTWGANSEGQLGNNSTLFTRIPQDITSRFNLDEDYIVYLSFYNHSLAVSKNGSLYGWGSNSAGQLGDGTYVNRLNPFKISKFNIPSNDEILEVIADVSSSYLLTLNGDLFTWGENSFDNSTLPVKINDFFELSENEKIIKVVTQNHGLGLTNLGNIYSWGNNEFNQLGFNNTLYSFNIPSKILFNLGTNQTLNYNIFEFNLIELQIEGFIFLGWYSDQEFEHEYDESTLVSNNIKLFPKLYKIPENTYLLEIDLENNYADIDRNASFHRTRNPFKIIFKVDETGTYNFKYAANTFQFIIIDEEGNQVGYDDPHQLYFADLEKNKIYYIILDTTSDSWWSGFNFEVFYL